jgi:4'-phosphopantetheinyl transferase
MLDNGAVDVWWARLREVDDPRVDLLTTVELTRFEAYRRDEDKRRFATGAAVVRLATGAYLGMPATDVSLDRTCPDCGRPHGQVRLPREFNLRVSVTHSGDQIGVAFARVPVGLDVERPNRGVDVDGLAKVTLDPAETAVLSGVPEAHRLAAFTRYWVRKEAALKATGDGLRVAPRLVTVSAPDEPPRLTGYAGRPGLTGVMRLFDVDPDTDHPAALAVLAPTAGELTVHSRDANTLLR